MVSTIGSNLHKPLPHKDQQVRQTRLHQLNNPPVTELALPVADGDMEWQFNKGGFIFGHFVDKIVLSPQITYWV